MEVFRAASTRDNRGSKTSIASLGRTAEIRATIKDVKEAVVPHTFNSPIWPGQKTERGIMEND